MQKTNTSKNTKSFILILFSNTYITLNIIFQNLKSINNYYKVLNS